MSGHRERFYVTTPIYYVNDIPHIGHAYTTIAADILARYNRLMGRKVFFLTGTDEHGQKVERAALDRGMSPKDHADGMVDNFKDLWKTLTISNDAFIRTTDAEHKAIVQDLLQRLWDSGEIEKRKYCGMYCTPCERFWTEKDLQGGMCPDCGRSIEEIEEENYFFLMSRYQERLIRHIEENPYFILPETRRNEVLGFLRTKPLGDLCISRPRHRLAWGIPLPFDDHYTTYVWFDALVNYYSATKYLAPQDKSGSVQWWPATHHLIGKDILTTHAVYWSTMLMALGLPLPENIFAHGWWTVEGKKMSKSVGNVVDPGEMARRFGVDAFRYFLFREVPFGLDGDFSQEAMVNRINTDLANDFGNLCSRVFTMVERYRGGEAPQAAEANDEIKALAEGLREKVESALHYLDFHRALDEIWALVSYVNKYIESSAPWALAKDPSLSGKLDTVLYCSVEAVRILALYLCPFIPNAAQKLWYQLGYESSIETDGPSTGWTWGGLRPGTKIRKGEALFPRIEKASAAEGVTAAGTAQAGPEAASAQTGEIGIEAFAKVELKVGRVIAAERVKKSAKLIKLRVDIGEERQVVAGIGKSYDPADLIGKYVVIVANLKPAKLMGVESRGMILAAGGDESKISLLTLDREVAPGTRVK